MKMDNIDVLILCGGLGTRLRGVLPEGTPKCMADINGTPFIDILSGHLRAKGFKRQVFAMGHGWRIVHEHLLATWVEFQSPSTRFKATVESTQLGTGGAIKNALPDINSDPFFVVNGDTFCELNYADILTNHEAVGFLATIPYDAQYGNVGTFVFTKAAIELAAAKLGPKWDLEEAFAVFPKGGIMVNWYPTDAPYLDIGTPAGLERFRRYWAAKSEREAMP